MRKIKIHGIYRHFKGDYYLVEELAKDSETKEDVVVYRSLYEDGGLWVRPLSMFLSEVDHQKYRFQLISSKSLKSEFKGK